MAYRVELSPRAERDLQRLAATIQTRVVRRLRRLALDPDSATGVKRLAGLSNAYRLRVGDYRVIYELRRDQLFILVIRIGHRREVYRGLP